MNINKHAERCQVYLCVFIYKNFFPKNMSGEDKKYDYRILEEFYIKMRSWCLMGSNFNLCSV